MTNLMSLPGGNTPLSGAGKTILPLSSILEVYSPIKVTIIRIRNGAKVEKIFHFITLAYKFFHKVINNLSLFGRKAFDPFILFDYKCLAINILACGINMLSEFMSQVRFFD